MSYTFLYFTGDIPLHLSIRETADMGTPITVSHPDSPQAKLYEQLATNVLRSLPEYKDLAGSARPPL